MRVFDNAKLSMAALAAGFSLALSPAFAVTVNLDGLGLSNGTVIEVASPGFGSNGPVTLNWAPTGELNRALLFWNGDYSGRDAAYCGSGIDCALDLTVASGSTVTLDSFWLGGYFNADQNITWSVIDLFDNATVASTSSALVSGSTGLTNAIGATSTAGFRILFGPDGFNGGINDIVYSFARVDTPPPPPPPPPPEVIPLPAGLPLLLAGLGALGLLRRRR